MNYELHYNNLIEKAFNRKLSETIYKEKHHIVPKCLGGDNSKTNLVELLPREHYIAHLLLFRIHPNNKELAYAFWMMSNGNRGDKRKYKVSARSYEEIRNKISELNKEKEPFFKGRKHTDESNQKNREAKLGNQIWLGKTHKEESKQKMKEKRLGIKDSLETRNKKSKAKKGIKLSEKHCEKLSKTKSGEFNPMFGKIGSENKRSKPVEQFDLENNFIKDWDNARIAAEKLKLNYKAINKCCNGKSLTSGGFIWKFKIIQ